MVEPCTTRSRSNKSLLLVLKLLRLLGLLNATLEVLASGKLGLIHKRDEQRRLSEEISHLLKGSVSGLGEDSPEVDGIGEVADLNCQYVLLVRLSRGELTMKRIYHLQPMPCLSSRATEVV